MATTSRGERYLPVARLPSVRYARGSVGAEDVPELLLDGVVQGRARPPAAGTVAVDVDGAPDGERDRRPPGGPRSRCGCHSRMTADAEPRRVLSEESRYSASSES